MGVTQVNDNIYRVFSSGQPGTDYEIIFDLSKKTMYLLDDIATLDVMFDWTLEDSADIYTIGESLINFLELDLDTYNRRLDDFFKNYKNHNFSPARIEMLDLNTFLNALPFKHPYFYSLDIFKLSEMHWDKCYSEMKIDMDKVNELRCLIKGMALKKYCSNRETKSIYSDRYVFDIDSALSSLFSDIQPLHQRMHYDMSLIYDRHEIQNFNLHYRYFNTNPMSFCITEFCKMLECNISIKICKNCGRFFIPENNHNIEYCNRLYKATGLTCKKIGATTRYKQKVNDNPILKEYEKAYKRNYARQTNHKMTSEEFRIWTEEATKKREEFLSLYTAAPSDQIIADFKLYLGNK